MQKLRDWLLPVWARTGHPLPGYEIARRMGRGRRRATLVQLAVLALLVGGGALLCAAADIFPAEATNFSGALWRSLYLPSLALQVFCAIMAMALGANAVDAERSRKAWDKLRATEFGAAFALRARWAGILYRLRAPIALILALRLIHCAGTLYDLTAFGGHYPAFLAAQARPPLPNWRPELPLIACAMTAAILLPPAIIASATALGMLLAVAIRERVYSFALLLLLAAVKLVFAGAGALALSQASMAEAAFAESWQTVFVFAYSGFGDWGLQLAQLGSLGQVWKLAPFGWAVSLGLMALLAALALAGDRMMWLAVRVAERRG